MTEFSARVIALVRSIPSGVVATYSQVATLAGKPQGARGVAWILNSSSDHHELPWHRVLNSKGRISFPVGSKNFRLQKKLLVSEGVEFDSNYHIDLKKFQWKKKAQVKKSKRVTPQMFR